MNKVLYRFEDKYGMHTVVTAMLGLQSVYSETLYRCGDIYLQHSLTNPACFAVADIETLCAVNDIDKVIIFFDTDSVSGSGIISHADIQNRYIKIPGADVMFYPVAWCAETLLYYQFCPQIEDAEIFTVPRIIRESLSSIAGADVKKTHMVLQPAALHHILECLHTEGMLNQRLINFLIQRSDQPYTIKELESWLESAQVKYNRNINWWK